MALLPTAVYGPASNALWNAVRKLHGTRSPIEHSEFRFALIPYGLVGKAWVILYLSQNPIIKIYDILFTSVLHILE